LALVQVERKEAGQKVTGAAIAPDGEWYSRKRPVVATPGHLASCRSSHTARASKRDPEACWTIWDEGLSHASIGTAALAAQEMVAAPSRAAVRRCVVMRQGRLRMQTRSYDEAGLLGNRKLPSSRLF